MAPVVIQRLKTAIKTARNALSLVLLGAGSIALALPLSSQAAGFSEDAKVTLGLRNFCINRNFVDPAFPQGKAEEWTQSFILDVRSGFTEGPVGFGVDVLGLYALKLDGGRGTRIPGLTLMNRYTSGDNVHVGATNDGKEWGRETELAYVIQSGTFKSLSMKWRNASIRRDYSSNEFDENRLIFNYPLSIL